MIGDPWCAVHGNSPCNCPPHERRGVIERLHPGVASFGPTVAELQAFIDRQGAEITRLAGRVAELEAFCDTSNGIIERLREVEKAADAIARNCLYWTLIDKEDEEWRDDALTAYDAAKALAAKGAGE